MDQILPILKKELRSYFSSPLAYVILFVFQIITGWFFYIYLIQYVNAGLDPDYHILKGVLNLNEFVIRQYMRTISIVFLLMLPLVSMRLISEERRQHTYELMFTSPVSVHSIILGKYLAALVLLVLMLGLSGLNIFLLLRYGNPEVLPILSGYLGLFLLGATYLSLGLFASSITKHQMIAGIVSFGILLFLWMVGALAGESSGVLQYLSIIYHFESFSKGVFELRDLVYYLSFIFFGLFITWRVLESERWR